MRLFDNLNIDFLGKRKTAYIVSGIFLAIGLLSVVFRGLELGIDFKGGTEIALQFEQDVDIAQIRADVNDIGLGNVEVKTFGGTQGVILRTELQEIPASIFPRIKNAIEASLKNYFPEAVYNVADSTSNSLTYQFGNDTTVVEISDKLFELGYQTGVISANQMVVRVAISDWLEETLKSKLPDNHFTVLKEDQVGPKIGGELKRDSLIAVVLALLVILVYLGFRFKFAFALGAVIAVFHDVLITLGIFSLLYGLIPGLNLEISISVVASFLTLVGYSINDTVIVFDRVREYMKIHKTADLQDNINRAINRTMSRTVVTSGTTMLVITVLLIFGGDVLRGFAFTLVFGIIVGTYSSIFVASAFILEFAQRSKKRFQF